jgi:hypothetical protein
MDDINESFFEIENKANTIWEDLEVLAGAEVSRPNIKKNVWGNGYQKKDEENLQSFPLPVRL